MTRGHRHAVSHTGVHLKDTGSLCGGVHANGLLTYDWHMEAIEERIRAKLAEMEAQTGVWVLHAVESGSRAWGFASPDSDYDVRFIYVRSVESYLDLGRTRDVIDWQLDEVYDINGWDLAKALRLLHASNPTLFEWRASPIVYSTRPQWTRIAEVFDEYFQPVASIHHYLSMANRNIKDYLGGDTVKLKKYFYVIRPLLAARWILSTRTPPPMLFTDLVREVLPAELNPVVTELLDLKAETSELGAGPHIAVLDSFIHAELATLDTAVTSIPSDRSPGWEPLDKVFRDLLFSLPPGQS